MIAALFVENRNSHQTVHRRAIRIESALAQHDVVDVFGNEFAAVTVSDLGLQKNE